MTPNEQAAYIQGMRRAVEEFRRGVSCFGLFKHPGDEAKQAMWDEYAKDAAGIVERGIDRVGRSHVK